jgi:hypothetical protein
LLAGIGSIADPDLGIDLEKFQQSLHARRGAWRPVDADRAGVVGVVHHAHQGTEAVGVVAMGMGDEDRVDGAEVGAEPGQAARHAVACVDDVLGPVDDEEVRGLCAPDRRIGTRARAERDEARAGFCGWGTQLRAASRRQRQAGDCQQTCNKP